MRKERMAGVGRVALPSCFHGLSAEGTLNPRLMRRWVDIWSHFCLL